MAMKLGAGGVQSEINVTPLIDVVLVLLIIFMVVVPLVERRFVLAVPEEDVPEQELPEEALQPLVVHLAADGKTQLNNETLSLPALLDKLASTLKSRDEKVVFFDAEDRAPYGAAVDLMDACRGAGAKHIGVIDPQASGDELPVAPVAAPAATPELTAP